MYLSGVQAQVGAACVVNSHLIVSAQANDRPCFFLDAQLLRAAAVQVGYVT